MYALSIDLDWAPSEALDFTLDILHSYGVRATIFCTHPAKIGNHEAAIHPNFEKAAEPAELIRELQEAYPTARGVRSHALHINSRLYQLYRQMGLQYSSSYYMYNQKVRAFPTVAGMVEVPIFFEDDLYFIEHDNIHLALNNLDLDGTHLKVFNFHPIHVFMNTYSSEYYQKWKPYYQDAAELKTRMESKPGTRDMLISLLDFARAQGHAFIPLNELAQTAMLGN